MGNTKETKWLREVCNIADIQLGAGYLTPENLKKITHDNSYTVEQAVTPQGSVVAFLIAKVTTFEMLANSVKYDFREIPNFFRGQPIGVIETVAVLPEYTGNHVGFNLVKTGIDNLRAAGVRHFTSVAWKPGEKSNIGGILQKNGIAYAFTVPDYWHEDSKEKGYKCPKCGNPCNCAADIHFGII